jgi:ribosomal-protein-alanine N-acetyltransferase
VNAKKQLSFRFATRDDVDALAEIESRSGDVGWGPKAILGEIEKEPPSFWVLTDDDTDSIIYAYIVARVAPGSHIDDLEPKLDILNLVVDLPYRRQGLGRKCLQVAVQAGLRANASVARLSVRKTNAGALALYQGVGFVITRVRKAFYSNGDDAYELELPLQGTPDSF